MIISKVVLILITVTVGTLHKNAIKTIKCSNAAAVIIAVTSYVSV